jgi:S1-C subfamily serine protease
MVTEVHPDSAAASASLKPGDVIILVGNNSIASPDDLQLVLSRHPVGVPLAIDVIRSRERFTFEAFASELRNEE